MRLQFKKNKVTVIGNVIGYQPNSWLIYCSRYVATNNYHKFKLLSVLLTNFYWKLDLSGTVYMQGTSTERNIFDVRETVRINEEIVPFIVAAHSL